ncbi:MAG: aspartate kinase [Gammaproteobacteria bacterium RIFCSPHIGHO2_12_FULL_37_34]|nr:MAG: aspartate kinase [Gammaproteobacteria bacterium RIFCSPHIGHO2_12_FULL_37_34]
MALIVQKYGGSSVGTLDRIHHVASKIAEHKRNKHDIVVVVSAMYGETDRLIHLAHALTPHPDPREFDVLISTGEQVSMALLCMALHAIYCPARSFTSSQIGIQTDDVYNKARILNVKTDRIKSELQKGHVIVIAGFQGITQHGDITTLGRGGSDTTAVAIAAALRADECQIYTDVDGVYTTDPHLVPEAQLLPIISFEEMLEMASLGAKVLQMRSVELASKHNMPIRVLSTFSSGPGTLVTFEDKIMHKRLVSGIAFSQEEAIISLAGIPKQIGLEGLILDKISQAYIEIDMIAQNTTAQDTVDFTFTVQRREHSKALKIIEDVAKKMGATSVKTNAKVAKLSLVGIGMRSHTGVASVMFKALGEAGIPIQMITTSEIKISVVIDEAQLERGVRVVHQAFNLDQRPVLAENYIE